MTPSRLFVAVALPVALLSLAAVAVAQRGDRPHHGPPPEALAACEGRASGDACSVVTPDGSTVAGTCGAPDGHALACMPAGGPPHGHHGPPPGAIDACADVSAGDACVLDTPHGTLEGTCEGGPAGIACRPLHPPAPPSDRGA